MIDSKSAAAARLLAALSLLCHCSSTTPSTSTDGGSGGEDAQAGMSNGEGGAPAAGGDSGGKGPSGESGSPSTGDGGAGTSTGGHAGQSGSSGEAGGGGGPVSTRFMLGADISSLPELVDAGTTFLDTDGTEKDLISILSNHGFNYVRLRTFVEPSALYGYADPNGLDQYKKAESYCDTAHTLEVAVPAKQAGMGFLLDLHYSDNWADPGKQVIPAAWRGATSITELANYVRAYTTAVVSELVAGGARPDIVQIGNEITPGLLIHVPGANPGADQWGNMPNKLQNPVNGSTSDFNNVATLLKAGVDGVKAVDPTIQIMLHLANTNSFPAVRDWVNNVRARGVQLDVLGLSCYPAWQGLPNIWEDTFQRLTENLDDLSFVIAEYDPYRTEANQMMADLPDGRGLGTFIWEPTQNGNGGTALFDRHEDTLEANAGAFAEFDALKVNLGLE